APAGTSISSWSASGTANTVYTASGNGNIADIVSIPNNGVITYTVDVAVPSNYTGATLINTASVTVPNDVTDPVSNNNEASDEDNISLVSDLAITKTDNNTEFTPGTTV